MKPALLTLVITLLSFASARADWPDYRGPSIDGHVVGAGGKPADIPLQWSETENVRWKTSIPFRGWSSPVVMEGRIWLTTATEDGHDFYGICIDEATGKILYNEKLFHSEAPEPLGNAVNCYAAPSPVVEAGRVYLHFGSYGTACIDTKTLKTLWTRQDLPCRHFRGPGSSPFLFGDLLILTMDGIDLQYVVALNKNSGETAWKTDRSVVWNDLNADGKPRGGGDFRKGFSTPIVIDVEGKKQLISSGAKAAYGYDPLTGKEIWKVHYGGQGCAPRPIFGNGLIYICTGLDPTELLAIRAGGTGEITDTHIAWRANRGVPKFSSPVLVDKLLFMVTDNGVVSCLDAVTGNPYWQERVGGEFYGSLLYSDGRIYCFSGQGKTVVLAADKEYKILATNTLDSGMMASAAFSEGSLFLRTRTDLYRIGGK